MPDTRTDVTTPSQSITPTARAALSAVVAAVETTGRPLTVADVHWIARELGVAL